ncbi:MAG: B12-binding domain-containing radical SAM protein [Promethearchaeota archaeon]
MKILLLNPPFVDQSQYGKPVLLSSCPGTGLSYLYSYLKKHNYNCKIYDFLFDSWDYIENVIREENADIIGITCLTEGRFNAFKLLSLIRRIKKNTIVIFGGHHATYMYEQLLEHFEIDYIVLGEGERKLLNLIRAIEGKISRESVRGIAYKVNGKIIINSQEENDFIVDLDSLPFPFNEEQIEIFTKYPSIQQIRPQKVKKFPMCKNEKIISIVTSRGCPFNCQFCSSTLFWGKKWRFRSPKNIVDEIEFYYKEFNFRYFNFADDAFTIIPKRSIEICREIVNRNLKIYFDCTTRADSITDDLVKWLKKAGCLFVAIGVESGSKKILKTINKKISPESVIKAFSILKKNKLHAYPLLMVGNPGETDETINKTIILLKIIKPTQIGVSKTMIFPGTELHKYAKAHGFIEDSFWLTSKPPPYYTYEHSLKTLVKWVFKIVNYDKNKYQLKILKLKQCIRNIIRKTYFLTVRNTKVAPILKKNFKKFLSI